MRIAFFGLAYHTRTGSSRFILDLLARHGTVETFFAEAETADLRRQAASFDEARYDAILVWQLHQAFALLSGRHPNVTFAPMHDAMFRGGAFLWRRRFGTAKILCFSWALRQEVMRRAAMYRHVQYFPAVGPRSAAADDPALRAFLWYRRREVAPERVVALTAGTPLASLAIHDAPDPGHEGAADWPAPPHVARLVRTTWSKDRAAFDAQLAAANLFFASRPLEGIGMSFLEAMAAGLCVVAPDGPTMNEYISHGRNGLLYAPDRMAPLDLSAVRTLGAAARESVARGRERWEAGVPALEEFLLSPKAALTRHAVAAARPAAGLAIVGPGQPWPQSGWVVFQPPGQEVTDPASFAALLASQPPEIGAVTGHHLQVAPDGSETLIRPAEPGAAWQRLLDGEVGPGGPLGMPIAAATAFRAGLVQRLDAAGPGSDAALFDMLLRAREAGAGVAEAEHLVARRAPMAFDPTGWVALLRARGEAQAADRFAHVVAAAARAAAARQAAARPARLALSLVSWIDRLSPQLADAVETSLGGGAWRRLRALRRRAGTP